LPGCFAYAPSREEAVAKLQTTIESYLASFDAAAPVADGVEVAEHYIPQAVHSVSAFAPKKVRP
jgi:predicted RNase H-like HicB family nuclease